MAGMVLIGAPEGKAVIAAGPTARRSKSSSQSA